MKTVDVLPEAAVPATFFQRAFAWLIDQIVLFILQLFIVLLFLVVSLPIAAIDDTSSIVSGILFSGFSFTLLILSFSWFLYRFITESRMNGQTIGKRLLGVRVVKENGFLVTTRDVLVRELLFILFGAIPLTFLINVILVAFTEKKQALHDLIAKTMVVPAR